MEAIISRPTAVINRFAGRRSAIVAAHRFFKNKSVHHHQIMGSHYQYLAQRVSGRDLICIQDTTEYNYQHHSGIISPGELGKISDNRSMGLRVHPVVAMDARDGFTYGLSSFKILNRAGTMADRHERHYEKLPVEEKESYRWLEAIQESKKTLAGARSLTFVSDRESDIYQLWSRVPDERTHLVIRSSFLRKFTDLDEQTQVVPTSRLSPLGTVRLKLPPRIKSGAFRGANRVGDRDLELEIMAGQVYTLKPRALKRMTANADADRIALTLVMARQLTPESDPAVEPVNWFLLTDLPATNLQQAQAIIDIYKSRWHIEQVFRLSKQKGFNLEESQLERAHSLENMICMVYLAAVRIYQMVSCRDNQGRSGGDLFEPPELDLLEKIKPGLEGRTERSKNKNKTGTLAYYLWIVARLGNWKPEDRDPPGPITFKRGWETFENYRNIARIISPP